MIPPSGDEDNGEAGETGLGRLGHIPPRHLRHTQISQKQIELVRLQQPKTLRSSRRYYGLMAKRLQKSYQDFHTKRIIIDD